MEFRRRLIYSVGFGLLLLSYGLIGGYGIFSQGLTSDEPAYLGAAYAYSQGVGLNPEHPLLLKLINSLLFSIFWRDIQIPLPDPSILDSVQIRLVAFDTGYQLLMYNLDKFNLIVWGSRFIYLGINSLFLFWLYSYSLTLKIISPSLALMLGVFWVFSPSFLSHSSLVSFDIAVATSAFITIVTTAGIINSILEESSNQKNLLTQFIILTLSLFFGLNTKFSNLLLLPIVAIPLLISIIYLVKTRQKSLVKFVGLATLVCLGIQPLLMIGMYGIAFRSMPDQTLGQLFKHGIVGVQMTLMSTKGEQIPFLMGQFRPITYGNYIQKLIWFKENPVLFLSVGLLLSLIVRKLWHSRYQLRHTIKPYLQSHNFRYFLIATLFLSIYPLAYAYLAQGSRFVIGYRYFYPVLLFLYLLIAFLLQRLRRYYGAGLLGLILGLYIIFGMMAVPQGLSYVNLFWQSPKWLLVNDSTLNWGQENLKAVSFLYDQNLLPKANENHLIHSTFNTAININQYIELLNHNQNSGLDIQSYYRQPRFDPLDQRIQDLNYRYLLIDSTVLQQLWAESRDSQSQKALVAKENLAFLQTNTPIYTHNDIMFIYEID